MRKKRSARRFSLLILIPLLFGFGNVARAADLIIHLRNGDRVTGAVEAETATEVTIRSGVLGRVTVPIGQILRRESASTPLTNVVTAATAPAVSTNKPAVVAAAPPAAKPPPPKVKHWNTELQLGLNLRYTTKDQQEALVIAKSTYSNGRFREILDYNFSYGQTEDVQSANRMNGSSKTEWDFTPKSYVFGLAGAGYDEIRRVDRQFEINPGVGYTWVRKPDIVFKTEVGLGYQDQFYSDGREVNTYAGRFAGIFTWRIWDKLMADGRLEYFPNVLSVDEYRVRFESTLRYPLFKNISLNLVVIDLYDTQAPPGVENNDLQVRSAIGVKF